MLLSGYRPATTPRRCPSLCAPGLRPHTTSPAALCTHQGLATVQTAAAAVVEFGRAFLCQPVGAAGSSLATSSSWSSLTSCSSSSSSSPSLPPSSSPLALSFAQSERRLLLRGFVATECTRLLRKCVGVLLNTFTNHVAVRQVLSVTTQHCNNNKATDSHHHGNHGWRDFVPWDALAFPLSHEVGRQGGWAHA
jgi:hypothetical protein